MSSVTRVYCDESTEARVMRFHILSFQQGRKFDVEIRKDPLKSGRGATPQITVRWSVLDLKTTYNI